jgi:hypothetical protein
MRYALPARICFAVGMTARCLRASIFPTITQTANAPEIPARLASARRIQDGSMTP